MKLILSHPTGNANVRAAANGFESAGIIGKFHTTIASFPGDILDKISIGPFAEIKRRQFDAKLSAFTQMNPWFEIGRLLAPKIGLKKLTRHEFGPLSIDAIYRNLDQEVALELDQYSKTNDTIVYAYEDGAKYSFEKAKQLDLKCYYDLPIGYWRAARRLLKEEIDKWPDWSATLTGFRDSEAKLANKDAELRLADHIFVASSFTAKTLLDFPDKLAPISVIPYGFPTVNENRQYTTSTKALKILFVGGLSQRKGIANLFAAVESFGDYVELTVVGKKANNNCLALDTALAKHKWIPSLPHAEILKLMQKQDVLVFPSLFEGFGLVITESMSQGTPVITTDRTIGPDIIRHEENGWIVEAGSTLAIQETIEQLLSRRNLIEQVGRSAIDTARGRPWEVYGKELAEEIKRVTHSI